MNLRSKQRGFLLNHYRMRPAPDPHWANVTLLIQGIGIDGGTTVVDSGPLATPLVQVGAPVTSTAQAKFGTSSLKVGSGLNYLYASNTGSRFDLPGDFTWEAWAYLTSSPGESGILTLYDYATPHNSFVRQSFRIDSYERIVCNGAIYTPGNDEIGQHTLNVWHHMAFSRQSGTVRVFRDGVLRGSNTSAAIPPGVLTLGIGAYGETANNQWQGYLDEIRITKGIARYTADFAVPTARFPTY